MSPSGPAPWPRQVANPFASAAIASVTTDGPDPVTTRTEAVRAARAELDRYLDRTAGTPAVPPPGDGTIPRPAEGAVLAVIGDYGSGKTHLCVDLVRRSLRARSDTTTTVYLAVTAGTFVELYRQLLGKFKRCEIVAQVRRYYADAVEPLLAGSEVTRDLACHVRDPATDVQALVERLRLPQSEILREVVSRLSTVTERPDFATALTLLLRSGFEEAAWNWLEGEDPEEVLRERGIHEAIDTEQRALEAIGVIALLHGRPGHRFVLVLDEFQQVLDAITRDRDVDRHRSATMASFRTLLSTCLKAGTMLVVSGIPDVLAHLDEDVRERITRVVPVQPLSEKELADFLARSLEPVPGSAGTEPFTPEAVEALQQITDGSVRKIVQLCHHSFRRFQDDPGPIDAGVVQDVARDHLGQSSLLQVRDRIGRILDNRGWNYLPRQRVGQDPDSYVDGWVQLRRSDRRCAILLVDVLTNDADLQEIRRRLDAVHRDRPESPLLVVVNRYLSNTMEEQLRSLVDVAPLHYDSHPSFEADLIARLEHVQRRVVGEHGLDPLDMVQDRIGRLDSRQMRIHDSVETMADRLEELLSAVQRQRILIQQMSQDPGHRSATAAGGNGEEQLPRDVVMLFRNALETLEDLQQLDRVFVSLFDSAQSSPDGRSTLSSGVRSVLRSDRTGSALSVGIQLRSLVGSYQTAVRNWWTSRTEEDRDHRLRILCRAYETAYEYLPVSRLSNLAELAEVVDGPAARRRTTRTIERLTASLYELGARVEQAASGTGPTY